LQGLFAGVMTGAALAISKYENYFGCFLKVIFADEIELMTNSDQI